jgi:hypothetical protein
MLRAAAQAAAPNRAHLKPYPLVVHNTALLMREKVDRSAVHMQHGKLRDKRRQDVQWRDDERRAQQMGRNNALQRRKNYYQDQYVINDYSRA